MTVSSSKQATASAAVSFEVKLEPELVATPEGCNRRGPDDVGQLLCVFEYPRTPSSAVELFRSTAVDPEFRESAEQHTRIADQMTALVQRALADGLLRMAIVAQIA